MIKEPVEPESPCPQKHRRKLTPEQEQKRQEIVEQIGYELEDVREILNHMGEYYNPKTFDTDNLSVKELRRYLNRIEKDETELMNFREKHIPDELWYNENFPMKKWYDIK